MEKLFIPAYYKKDPVPSVKKALVLIEEQRIGLLASSQHIDQLGGVRDFLVSEGKSAVLGGQVLGCNADNAEKIEKDVDCFLFIGSGRFHPTWVAVKTDKKVYMANPYSDTADEVSAEEKKKYLSRRKGRILKASSAEVFGVIVSTKPGQMRLNEAWDVVDRLRGHGRRAYLFAGNETSPDNLLPFKVDAWINTACPRLADDSFEKPVVNLSEFPDLEFLL